jgi:uncharacterized membrane protein (Fun14 family)
MTELQAVVLQTIINDITIGTVIGFLLGFAIVVMRKKT